MAEIVLCIGNGAEESDRQSRGIAKSRNLPYHWVLDVSTDLKSGLYHTSVYDITLAQLRIKIQGHRASIVVLDIPITEYEHPRDYADTKRIINELSPDIPVEYVNQRSKEWFFEQIRTNRAFCVMPFVGVHQTSDTGSFCCHMPRIWDSKTDFFGARGNEIRRKILAGQPVNECKKCYDIDDIGGMSDRRSWNYDWAIDPDLHDPEYYTQHPRIKTLHLQLDNKCNLMCRMCDPKYSDLIAKEYKKIKILDPTFSIASKFDLKHIDTDALQNLMITGGEPTINYDFIEFLDTLPIKTQQVLKILISTNGVTLSKSMKKIMAKIPNLKFGISIDGADRVNHYIRWPASWNKLTKNIRFLFDCERLSHFNTTVSIYNICHLYDFYQWVDTHYPDVPCSMNFVKTPVQMVPWNRPDKQALLDQINRIKHLQIYQKNQVLKDNVQYICHKLESWQFDSALLRRFFEFNDILDRSRRVRLQDFINDLHVLRDYVDR